MLPILTFASPGLEAAYLSHASPTRARVAARFALFRLALLAFTAARALLAVPGCGREALLLLGAASNCLPLWAAVLSPSSRFAWLARWGMLGTEVLQATIGVINHRHMAPSHVGGQPAAALVYLPYGNTSLWLHCYGAFSPLPFHLLLVQQALVTMVLLAGSGSMCQESAGLRTGYAALHALVRRAWQAVASCRLPFISSWPAAVFALGWEPCGPMGTANSAAGLTPAAASGSAEAQPDAAARLCITYQLPVLLLGGFATSTWLAFRAECSSRLAWLSDLQDRTRRGAAGEGGSGGSASSASSGGSANESALRRAVAVELVEPLPSDADYWLQLALPCMLCISVVAHAIIV